MNISDIITKCYILALIIRDDGERLLLGDGFYEFKEQLQHFQPNIFQNDVIELQGTDGQLLAGQVRRGATQSFDGYIADPTISREATEQHRQRFLGFFRKKHHYKVVYVFPDGSAIKRERGYIVDAPAVQEMFQRFPEYHVGLNFEDVNYYEYEEGEDGEEIFAHVQNIAIAGYVEGGLIWDNYGAVSNDITWVDYALKTTTDGFAQITDGVLGAPLNLEQLFGNATQIAYTGKNLWGGFPADKSCSMFGINFSTKADGTISVGAGTVNGGVAMSLFSADAIAADMVMTIPAGTYTISGGTDTIFVAIVSSAGSQLYITTANNHERTFTLNDTTQCFLRVQIENGTTVAATTIYPMLVAGSSAGSYEPYTGSTPTRLQPSPNPDYPQNVNTVKGGQTVKIVGKNLLNFDTFLKAGEAVYTKTGNVYSITDTAYTYSRQFPLNLENGKTYTLSQAYQTQTSTNVRLDVLKNGSVYASCYGDQPENLVKTFTADNSDYTLRVNWSVKNYPLLFNSPMLEESPSKTDFEPYQEQLIDVFLQIGKNKFTDVLEQGAIFTTTGKNESTAATNRCRTVNYNMIKPSTVYTLSATGTNLQSVVLFYDKDRLYINSHGYTDNPHAFTTPNNARFIRSTFRHSDNTNIAPSDITQIQLEEGSSATAYEAPNPIELAKIGTYRDRIYENDGEWYKHAEIGKVVLTGSETWNTTANAKAYYVVQAGIANVPNTTIPPMMSDYYLPQAYKDLYDGLMDYATGVHPSQARIMIRNKDCADSNALKTWLSTHNTTVYYALATATDAKITDQELIQQLSTIKALVGEIDNIWLIPSSGAQGEMEVRYSRGFINQGAGYVWDAAQGGGPNVVSVDGIDRTGFVWEVVGPATNPTLTNITTNQTMTFEGDVAAGQTLTVNTSDQTATIEGTNVFAQMTGDWLELAAGNNIITYTATGTTDSSTIKWNGVVG